MKAQCKLTLFLLGFGAGLMSSPAAVLVDGASPMAPIPDASPSGLTSAIDLTTPAAESLVQKVRVTLTLSGSEGFNGDLYAYLAHVPSGKMAVLLNRPGRDSDNPVGAMGSGFDEVTLDDAAPAGDVHLYEATVGTLTSAPLSGVWAPDGRNVDPAVVTSSMVRDPAPFGTAFGGLDANGRWVLFVADLSEGGTLNLQSWSLEVTAIPELSTAGWWAGALAGMGGFVRWRRRHRSAARGNLASQ